MMTRRGAQARSKLGAASAWTLRKGALPSPRTIRREPRLEGLDANPVFRVLAFRAVSAPGGELWRRMFALPLICVFVIVMGSAIQGGGFGFFGFVVLIGFVMLSRFSTPRVSKRRSRRLFSIPDQFVQDMTQAAVPSEDFSVGLWANAVTRRQLQAEFFSVTLSAGLLGAGIVSTAWIPSWIRWPLLIALFFVGFQGGLLCFAPHHALPGQAAGVHNLWREIAWEADPLRALRRALLRLARFFSTVVLIIVFFSVFVSFILEAWPSNTVYRALPFDLSLLTAQPAFLPGAMICVFLLGALIGLARGVHVRRHAGRYLGRMTRHFDLILIWIRRGVSPAP